MNVGSLKLRIIVSTLDTYSTYECKKCVLKLNMMTIYSQGTIRRGTYRCRLLGAAEKPDAKK